MTLTDVQFHMSKILGPFSRMIGRSGIVELPQILWENEQIEHAISGFYKGGTVLWVATDKRLMLIDKKLFHRKVEEFAYDKIMAVEYDPGLFWGEMKMRVGGEDIQLRTVDSKSVPEFAEYVSLKLAKRSENAEEESPDTASKLLLLEKLSELRHQGVLNEDEFNQQKQEILGTSAA